MASILLGAAVALAVWSAATPVWRWFRGRVEADAVLYERWAEELFVDWGPERARRVAYRAKLGALAAALFAFVVMGAGIGGLIFGVVVGVVALRLPRFIYQRRRERRLKRLEEQLPEAVNVMVSAARAGLSLSQAVENVARDMAPPVGDEFRAITVEHQRGGLSLEEALSRARHRIRQENYTMVFTALIINNSQGGDVLHILEEIGDASRELFRLKKKIVTETTEVRMQQKVITYMTPFFFVLVLLFDENIKRILLYTLPGNLILLAVVVTQVACALYISRIVKAAI